MQHGHSLALRCRSPTAARTSLQLLHSSLVHGSRVVVGCRELDELTFFDAGPKPDWSKDKSPGYGRLDFLRPGGFCRPAASQHSLHMSFMSFRPQAANLGL